MSDNFFNEVKEQSAIKSLIVTKYFYAWTNVIKKHADRLVYLDLFAGPGRYKDGAMSTPLMILENALTLPYMTEKLVTVFNDKDKVNASSLEKAISQIPGIQNLNYKPVVWNEEVGENMVEYFKSKTLYPTFFFVDPWGYKGLSLKLVNSVVKDWACECVFFFNYNRINMGLGNDIVRAHMNALFGEERADELRTKLTSLAPLDREFLILEEICQALKDEGAKYVLPFTFKNDKGTRTSHHLIFASKHSLGYDIMKKVMYKESTSHVDGVATFAYNPADKRFPTLFAYGKNLDDLGNELLANYAGKKRTVQQLFNEHNYGTPFILKNYQTVIQRLQTDELVQTSRSEAHIKRNQCPPHIVVEFPK